jgi:hypothetical protein
VWPSAESSKGATTTVAPFFFFEGRWDVAVNVGVIAQLRRSVA